MLNREGLDVLVHPLTESSYDDALELRVSKMTLNCEIGCGPRGSSLKAPGSTLNPRRRPNGPTKTCSGNGGFCTRTASSLSARRIRNRHRRHEFFRSAHTANAAARATSEGPLFYRVKVFAAPKRDREDP